MAKQSTFTGYRGRVGLAIWFGFIIMGAFALGFWTLAVRAMTMGDSGIGAVFAFFGLACTAVVAWYFSFVWKAKREPVVELVGSGFTVGPETDVIPWDRLEAVGIKWVGKGKVCLKGWFRYRDGDDIKTVKLGSMMHSRRSMEELSMLLLTLAEPIVTSQANEDDGGEIEGLRYGRSGFECDGHGLVALEDVNGGLRCIEFVDRINSVDVLVRKKSRVVQALNSQSATRIGAIPPDLNYPADISIDESLQKLDLVPLADELASLPEEDFLVPLSHPSRPPHARFSWESSPFKTRAG